MEVNKNSESPVETCIIQYVEEEQRSIRRVRNNQIDSQQATEVRRWKIPAFFCISRTGHVMGASQSHTVTPKRVLTHQFSPLLQCYYRELLFIDSI